MAPVRMALMMVPSITAIGMPVSGQFKMINALARGKPRSRLAGKLPIHFMPIARTVPPMDAKSALKRP